MDIYLDHYLIGYEEVFDFKKIRCKVINYQFLILIGYNAYIVSYPKIRI